MVIGDAGNFFNFKEGGLAIEGGVVAVVIAGLIYFPIVLKLPRYQKVVTISAGVTEVRTISM
jgi:phosphatidylglycerol:prolipoprotein diacylglycerol transferase